MNEEDPNFILSILFGIIEKAIEKTILILRKEKGGESLFSIELFKQVIRVESYNLFTSDFFYEEVQEIIKNLKIDYNIHSKKEKEEEDEEEDEEEEDEDEDEEEEMENEEEEEMENEEESSEENNYLEKVMENEEEEEMENEEEEEMENEEESSEENNYLEKVMENENISMLLDFPLSEIVDIINNELEGTETETIDLTKDLNLIESIWEQWIPDTVTGQIFKNMIDHFTNSITFS